jgi:hypothetical protein
MRYFLELPAFAINQSGGAVPCVNYLRRKSLAISAAYLYIAGNSTQLRLRITSRICP